MSTSVTSTPPYPAAEPAAVPLRRGLVGRICDYVEIAKPRISAFVLITVAAGFLLSSNGTIQLSALCHALLGIALVAAGSSALNQYIERRSDARMERTLGRPIPSGRLAAAEVLAFGILAGLLGCVYLAVTVNWMTALLTGLTYLAYTLIYTPLKRVTVFNTVVGAVPGALPPVLGWTAAGGGLGIEPFSLFAILFLWQFPHFMAIAWLYRDDYRRAGLKMMPAVARGGRITGYVAVAYALALLPVSLLPGRIGLASEFYTAAALLCGAAYVWAAVYFCARETERAARWLLVASLVYLPAVVSVLVGEHIYLLS